MTFGNKIRCGGQNQRGNPSGFLVKKPARYRPSHKDYAQAGKRERQSEAELISSQQPMPPRSNPQTGVSKSAVYLLIAATANGRCRLHPPPCLRFAAHAHPRYRATQENRTPMRYRRRRPAGPRIVTRKVCLRLPSEKLPKSGI